jgi:hypothetical protein
MAVTIGLLYGTLAGDARALYTLFKSLNIVLLGAGGVLPVPRLAAVDRATLPDLLVPRPDRSGDHARGAASPRSRSTC